MGAPPASSTQAALIHRDRPRACSDQREHSSTSQSPKSWGTTRPRGTTPLVARDRDDRRQTRRGGGEGKSYSATAAAAATGRRGGGARRKVTTDGRFDSLARLRRASRAGARREPPHGATPRRIGLLSRQRRQRRPSRRASGNSHGRRPRPQPGAPVNRGPVCAEVWVVGSLHSLFPFHRRPVC